MNDFTNRVAETVGRHFVTLSCVQYPPNGEQAKTLVFSGFVVDISGEWFYVTAGHILRDVRAAVESGATFDGWRLGDQTAGNKFNSIPIPYSFELGYWFVLEDSETGLDYATVNLGGLYRMQLEAGGVSAIGSDAWGDHLTAHDQWALMGIPSETVAVDGKIEIMARVVMIPLLPIDSPLPPSCKKAKNQFYSRFTEGSERVVKDVDGMSGGPIFALKNVSGIWRYKIIGVQSAWYRDSGVLVACPFASFGSALEDLVRETLSIHNQLDGNESP